MSQGIQGIQEEGVKSDDDDFKFTFGHRFPASFEFHNPRVEGLTSTPDLVDGNLATQLPVKYATLQNDQDHQMSETFNV